MEGKEEAMRFARWGILNNAPSPGGGEKEKVRFFLCPLRRREGEEDEVAKWRRHACLFGNEAKMISLTNLVFHIRREKGKELICGVEVMSEEEEEVEGVKLIFLKEELPDLRLSLKDLRRIGCEVYSRQILEFRVQSTVKKAKQVRTEVRPLLVDNRTWEGNGTLVQVEVPCILPRKRERGKLCITLEEKGPLVTFVLPWKILVHPSSLPFQVPALQDVCPRRGAKRGDVLFLQGESFEVITRVYFSRKDPCGKDGKRKGREEGGEGGEKERKEEKEWEGEVIFSSSTLIKCEIPSFLPEGGEEYLVRVGNGEGKVSSKKEVHVGI